MRINIFANTSWNIYNFRINLIKFLIKKKYNVTNFSGKDKYSEKLNQFDFKNIFFDIKNRDLNIINQILIIFKILYFLYIQKPNVVLSFTIKMNIYIGLIRLIFFNFIFIPNITGLGSSFDKKSKFRSMYIILYKLSFKKANHVFFQNNRDYRYFRKLKIVENNFTIIPGSGIDVEAYKYKKLILNKNIKFLFASRLLKEKGIREYLLAAEIIKKKYKNASFYVLGSLEDEKNKKIEKILLNYHNKKIINYLGVTNDIPHHIMETDCLIMPTYYNEGIPRILIEAAALGRPIITTNQAGCKDICINNYNGFIINKKNLKDLSLLIEKYINLSDEKKNIFSQNGRKLVEAKFNDSIILEKYYHAIENNFKNI